MPATTLRRRLFGAVLVTSAVLTTGALTLPASPASAQPGVQEPALAPRLVGNQPSWPAGGALRDPLADLAGAAYRSLAWSQDLGPGVEALRYTTLRDEVARQVADRVGVPAEDLQEIWAAASVERQLALLAGLTHLGVPYRSMKSSPGQGFDCSGLTSYAWRMAEVTLPRNSRDQMRAAEKRDAFTALPGDLVYFPGHVMMSLGVPSAVLHSPQTGRVVEVEMLTGSRANRLQYADPLA